MPPPEGRKSLAKKNSLDPLLRMSKCCNPLLKGRSEKFMLHTTSLLINPIEKVFVETFLKTYNHEN